MVEIQVAPMLAARRLLLDSPMNSDKPEGTFPTRARSAGETLAPRGEGGRREGAGRAVCTSQGLAEAREVTGPAGEGAKLGGALLLGPAG